MVQCRVVDVSGFVDVSGVGHQGLWICQKL